MEESMRGGAAEYQGSISANLVLIKNINLVPFMMSLGEAVLKVQ